MGGASSRTTIRYDIRRKVSNTTYIYDPVLRASEGTIPLLGPIAPRPKQEDFDHKAFISNEHQKVKTREAKQARAVAKKKWLNVE